MSAEAGYSTTITINKGHSRTTAGLCALFLGGIGLHKFYLGKPIQGLFYVFFCWTFIPAFIALFEGIRYLMMSDAEFQSRLEQDKLDHIGGTFSVSGITPDTHVKCPDCRGFVPKEAKVCQHCNCKLVPQ
ncbi:TM2 domain-containing protein [Undibacterium umbellatum]|uniref:TM2 domain-containing protein n=1 Tax=Undibacterium umbellatum TaxID=2762300 RepID=UPI003BB7747A